MSDDLAIHVPYFAANQINQGQHLSLFVNDPHLRDAVLVSDTQTET